MFSQAASGSIIMCGLTANKFYLRDYINIEILSERFQENYSLALCYGCQINFNESMAWKESWREVSLEEYLTFQVLKA
jgi:hypothetical protein